MGKKIGNLKLTNQRPEYGELISRDGSSLLMRIHLDIVNYQNVYRELTNMMLPSYLNMDHLHFDDFYANGFITPDRNKIHMITRDSFYPFRIEHNKTAITILASPIQINDQEIKLLNSGKKIYVKPFFVVSQRFNSWSLDTIIFNLEKSNS